MVDLFDREQQILDNAVRYMDEIRNGVPCDINKFGALIEEYDILLKQLRRITKISDRTTINLNKSNLDLQNKVHYDALTGIRNRQFIEDNLKRVIKVLSHSGGSMLSVLMMDVDFFKNYNDTYGHSMGDDCLRSIAKALSRSLTRPDDFVARYGGEEFIAVLPNTDEYGACTVAGKILENVRACNIPHEKNEAASCVTISIGITTANVNCAQSVKDYIKRADEALYVSKLGGRNRYTVYKL